jgi:hypothetical protein
MASLDGINLAPLGNFPTVPTGSDPQVWGKFQVEVFKYGIVSHGISTAIETEGDAEMNISSKTLHP